MQSIRELFRIGLGPSSSHTMGPRFAALRFIERTPDAESYRVTLFSSLAATGEGHLTDRALIDAIVPKHVEIMWKPKESLPKHPNGMLFEALDASGSVTDRWEVYSVGGGALLDECGTGEKPADIYPHTTLKDIMDELDRTGETLWEYVFRVEDDHFYSYLKEIWGVMQESVSEGLRREGVLPGGLGLARKASSLHRKAMMMADNIKQNGMLAAFAYAVAEQNACGGTIVTAPTCGAAGVLPAVLTYLKETLKLEGDIIIRALATAGLLGNLIKENASISGAEVGCQGEIGTACSMAAGAACQLMGGSTRQVEYAAEMGMEHLLGLTCDPVKGLVQIPCIERNAHAAVRALGCAHFSLLSDGTHKISFDEVVAVMKKTGHAIPPIYRETSEGGLAEKYRERLG